MAHQPAATEAIAQEQSPKITQPNSATRSTTEAREASPPEQAIKEDEVAADAEVKNCPECGGSLKLSTAYTHEETFCESCGLVVEETQIDPGPEWRAFNAKESQQRSRVGSPSNVTRHDKGLGSTFNPSEGGNSWRLRRQERYHSQEKCDKKMDRNRRDALNIIQTVCSQLETDKQVVKRACYLFTKYQKGDGGYGPGSTLEISVGAIVYAACRDYERVVLLEQIAEHIPLSGSAETTGDQSLENALRREYSRVCRELALTPKVPEPTDFVAYFAEEVGLGTVSGRAYQIAACAHDQKWSTGNDPKSVAAAALYDVALRADDMEKRTQEELADIAYVSTVALRESWTNIKESVHPEILDDGA